ncbi:hypothetical protein VP01_2310g1 [Puccinia sorghi]|uniref:Pex N-terminal domain-containing protein n=1 Tax=Puccinia sorghi TaxID=27349 RepID=A0A0L6V7V2_9BASI|nr:hypothetical protein VP01_2310g1 [Puccinia sorghi]
MSSGARRPGGLASQLDSLAMDEEVSGMLLAPIVGSGRVAGMLVRLGMQLRQSTGEPRLGSWPFWQPFLSRFYLALTIRQILLYSLLAVVPGDLHGQLRDRMLSAGWADYSRQDGHGSLAHPSWQPPSGFSTSSSSSAPPNTHRSSFVSSISTSSTLIISVIVPKTFTSSIDRSSGRPSPSEVPPSLFLALLPLLQILTFLCMFLVRESLRRIGTQVWGSEVGSVQVSGRRMVPRRVATDRCGICSSAQMTASGGGGGLPMDPNEPLRVSPLPSSGSTLKLPYQVNCCGARYCYACLLSDILRWRELHLHDNRPWPCWICTSHPSALSRWNPAPLSN